MTEDRFQTQGMVREHLASGLREKVTGQLSYGLACHDIQITGTAEKLIADGILAIPEIKEAIDLMKACQSAFAVNGEFVITKEVLAGKGVTVTAMPKEN